MKCLLLLLVFAFLSPLVAGVPCTEQWQCMAVSNDYNYVACQAGQCACRKAQGFSGNATAGWPCGCASPATVHWDGPGSPYCVDYATCVDQSAQRSRSTLLKAKVLQVYSNLFPPAPLAILSGQLSVDHLFAPEAKGRIDPLGSFDSRTTLVEYYYALAANGINYASSVDVVSLIAEGDEVFIRINILFRYIEAVPLPPFNLTQSGRYKFDAQDLIKSVDLIIHNLGKASDPTSQADPAATINQMCATLLLSPGNCVPSMDPAGHYTDMADCVSYMNSIPFGSWDRASSNSVTCRFLHTLLTVFDPVDHCPHAGKTGGGKCIDTPYSDYYLKSF